MKFEVQNIIRSAAQGNLKKALELSRAYLTQIQKEKNNELKVMKIIQKQADPCVFCRYKLQY
jgi:hypothetical protein